jgi:hypothetical protein
MELINYVKNTLKSNGDPTAKLDRYFEYFTIMPADLDPSGIVPKIRHIMRSREDFTREQVKTFAPNLSSFEASKITNILEVVTTIQDRQTYVSHSKEAKQLSSNPPTANDDAIYHGRSRSSKDRSFCIQTRTTHRRWNRSYDCGKNDA